MLIKCPECGEKISDKAVTCVHCGYPMDTIIEEKPLFPEGIDESMLSEKLWYLGNGEIWVPNMDDVQDILRYCNYLDNDPQYKEIVFFKYPEKKALYEAGEEAKRTGKTTTTNTAQIKCPTCGSTFVSTISAAERAGNAVMFGLLGNKRRCQFKCENCGYMW